MTDQTWHRIQSTLTRDKPICTRCGASLGTYGDRCCAAADELCGGWMAIRAAMMRDE